ncbi:beta-ketoacyl synthase N-terminal-like domain-containing protein [Amycolatopsis anabasis]|uniref:beta-ketoacyl synthase N-terminal-like domain-containing protein n=1 Tax=Amycolatopsis anabasis TaxID=1840409 RepID=UPI00131E6427|nr:beta-ketoacyl synthase N-terminal-like domain-containing protein [Amycolatopsis anabasis]
MTAAPALSPVADIVGCGVFSAAGTGLEAITGLAPARPAPRDEPGWPPLAVAPVPGFDPAAVLGNRGLSRLSRTDQLAMAACVTALDAAGAGPDAERTGIALGMSVGSAATVLEFLRDTFERDRPYLVNPAQFPGTMMNSAAGKTAIRTGLTGVNATVSGGPVSGLHALRYACAALRDGHARRMLAGAVEELAAEPAWAWHRGGGLAEGTPLAEGGAVFALDLPGGSGDRLLGRILACETGFTGDGPIAVAARLAETVHSALDRAGVAAGEVGLLVPGAGGRRGWAAVEERALRAVFPERAARRLGVGAVLGETHGASAALQLATALANWAPGGEVAVLTSVGSDGSVGCLVVASPEYARGKL